MRDALIDLVLGGACVGCSGPGRSLCPGCVAALPATAADVRRVRPQPSPPGLAPAFASAEYADPLRSMILRHKEERVFALARPLGRVLAAPVRAIAGALPAGLVPVLVPVPSRAAVVRARGHDPMLRIARAAVRLLRGEGRVVLLEPLLRQRQVVADQAGLDAVERSANLAGALSVDATAVRRLSWRAARAGSPVVALVCDDVITTGATAREAQRALSEAGLPVAAIALLAATRKRAPPRVA